MQKPPTKAQLRNELQALVDDYLSDGGEIEEVAQGVSGREDHNQLRQPLFTTPKTSRTPVGALIARVESRRGSSSRPAAKPTPKPRPRLKTLYDDFGEPIRKIWVDE